MYPLTPEQRRKLDRLNEGDTVIVNEVRTHHKDDTIKGPVPATVVGICPDGSLHIAYEGKGKCTAGCFDWVKFESFCGSCEELFEGEDYLCQRCRSAV